MYPDENRDLRKRAAPLDMSPEEFRRLGYTFVDKVVDLLAEIRSRPVTPGESPTSVRNALGDAPLPPEGFAAEDALARAWELLSAHSLLNGHPRFSGYVTSPAAPVGILGDLMAAAVNPNAGAWILSPMATEIESQTVRWIAEFLGYPADCGGLLVSGGNMANFIGFLAARRAKSARNIRAEGVEPGKLVAYVSTETHTWIHKAADLFGLGTNSIRWIPVDGKFRMRTDDLVSTIENDRAAGLIPFFLSGSAGTVSTGAVDPLEELAEIARRYDLWFHVDGAYGAPAAALPGASAHLKALSQADSLAVDPHKWLYAPLEAGCALVRDRRRLFDTFDYSPPYYRFDANEDEKPLNYYSYGPQNSRGFRALKVWLGLMTAGREGLIQMIGDDIALARTLFREIRNHPELEAFTQSLSITTFRYVPLGMSRDDPENTEYLNRLNQVLLDRLQAGGEAFLSNAVIKGRFALRSCIVNFRTTLTDVEQIPQIVLALGRQADAELRAGL